MALPTIPQIPSPTYESYVNTDVRSDGEFDTITTSVTQVNTTSLAMYSPETLFYRIKPDNWYGTFPYFFEISGLVKEHRTYQTSTVSVAAVDYEGPTPDDDITVMYSGSENAGTLTSTQDGSQVFSYKFFLPIPPKSMTHQHIPASEATATLGGVVEETSQPVFHTITLVGTTGMSMRLGGSSGTTYTSNSNPDISVVGRKTFSDVSGNNTVGGRAVNAAMNAADKAVNLLSLSPEVSLPFLRFGSAVSASSDKISALSDFLVLSPVQNLWQKTLSTIPGKQPKEPSSAYMNGYAWSQALKQFFLIYQREKARSPQAALYFVDAKNNVRYRCVPRLVQFQKDSSAPFIETYNIVLKCWNPTDASESGVPTMADRFETDLREVYTVTAAGIYRNIRKIQLSIQRGTETGKSMLATMVRDTAGSFFD